MTAQSQCPRRTRPSGRGGPQLPGVLQPRRRASQNDKKLATVRIIVAFDNLRLLPYGLRLRDTGGYLPGRGDAEQGPQLRRCLLEDTARTLSGGSQGRLPVVQLANGSRVGGRQGGKRSRGRRRAEGQVYVRVEKRRAATRGNDCAKGRYRTGSWPERARDSRGPRP